jgi:hypothetical protein
VVRLLQEIGANLRSTVGGARRQEGCCYHQGIFHSTIYYFQIYIYIYIYIYTYLTLYKLIGRLYRQRRESRALPGVRGRRLPDDLRRAAKRRRAQIQRHARHRWPQRVSGRRHRWREAAAPVRVEHWHRAARRELSDAAERLQSAVRVQEGGARHCVWRRHRVRHAGLRCIGRRQEAALEEEAAINATSWCGFIALYNRGK